VFNWVQVLFNSAVTASLYLISAVALTLIYGLSRFPNFAHAEFMVLGAYAAYFVVETLKLPVALSFVIGFIVAGLVGVLCYIAIFKPLEKRGSSLIHLMVASMALGFIIRHTVGEIWGFSPLSINVTWDAFDVGPLRVNILWLWLILTAVMTGLILHLILVTTRTGKAMRATSSNPDLAESSGINTYRVVLTTWFLSAGLAGIAGLFRAAETRLSPLLGWDILLPVVAVTVLGGIGSFYGAIAAAFIIGFLENMGVVLLVQLGLSTEYRMAIPFVVLITVLIFKPQGLTKLFKGN
jgi:branched-subunit amino acid ABC-type transport system permease component